VRIIAPRSDAPSPICTSRDGFALTRRNALSVGGWRPLFTGCAGRADEVHAGLAADIVRELDHLEACWPDNCRSASSTPTSSRQCVLLANRLSGLIDFYFACNDMLAYDVAICINAWCFEADGALNITKSHALLSGYTGVRPLSHSESDALPLLCRGSALRFLLTASMTG